MIKTSIEKLVNSIAFDIGASDDVSQADMLNGFCKGLSNSIIDNDKLELQMCYIADKLDGNAVRVINRLNEFIQLREANNE